MARTTGKTDNEDITYVTVRGRAKETNGNGELETNPFSSAINNRQNVNLFPILITLSEQWYGVYEKTFRFDKASLLTSYQMDNN